MCIRDRSFANKSAGSASVGPSLPIDTWVSVTPKKRMRANRSVKSVKTPLPPPATSNAMPNVPVSAAGPSCVSPPKNPAPAPDPGILLAKPTDNVPVVDKFEGLCDPLQAIPGVVLDGMDDDSNVDMFLNLHNIDDVEMSTDSAKRKRGEDGEEVSSQAKDV